jgi:hypothetical protein
VEMIVHSIVCQRSSLDCTDRKARRIQRPLEEHIRNRNGDWVTGGRETWEPALVPLTGSLGWYDSASKAEMVKSD